MAGISHVLNIAKEALLAHQTAIGVAGHNVANVNTPGYTRQSLDLTTPPATLEGVGLMGNGVRGQRVARHYDRFMVNRIINHNSALINLEAQQQTLNVVEATFNEAPGMGLNELLSDFWQSWHTLAANPELTSSRQSVVQRAELLNDRLHSMHAEIIDARHDLGLNLHSAVQDVNELARQIAELNGQITSTETELHQQNDIRDQRDSLVKELAGLMEINYFETDTGAYTVLMADGHALVENNEHWAIDWQDNQISWLSQGSDGSIIRSTINDSENLGGKIGGWTSVHNQLIDNQPNNYLGRLNALANALVREVNQQHSQGTGLERFSEILTSMETASNTTLLTSTMDISAATETIPAGTFTINGRQIGLINGGITNNGLAMAKAFNAAQAINQATSDVRARLTTQVSGDAVTPMSAGEDGTTIDFTINGVDISYSVDSLSGPPDDTDPATLAANLVNTINNAIGDHNDPVLNPGNIPGITIEAVVGNGVNGGAINSIVLRNTNQGDESRIIIQDLETDPANPLYTVENKLGLTNGEYIADADHNTGQLSLFSHNGPITINGGSNDHFLAQLGLGGGDISATDEAGDGLLSFTANDNSVSYSLMGYDYSDELATDNGSFNIWLYNNDGTLALPQPVEISMERSYNLQDVANAINISIMNASGESSSWVHASIYENQLVLTPDAEHQFAFGGDTSNFLATAGLNTFLSGHDAGTITINNVINNDLDFLAAGRVNESGEIFRGDQSNALTITEIQHDEYIRFTGSSSDTLDGHYNALLAEIGMKGRSVGRDLEFNSMMADQLNELRESSSGVSLDEEMANLINFQHAYTAAAKLISSSDEMLNTLLQAV